MSDFKLGDSDYGKWRDRLELETTIEQDLACVRLEGYGQRFLVDFGYENAVEKLKQHRREMLDGKPAMEAK